MFTSGTWNGKARTQLGQQRHFESSSFRESWVAVGAESEWHICLGQHTLRDHCHYWSDSGRGLTADVNNIENEELSVGREKEMDGKFPKAGAAFSAIR